MLFRRWQRIVHAGSWELGIALDISIWVFGIYYENSIHEITLLFGPFIIWCSREPRTEKFWPSGSLFLLRWGRLELRVDWSTHQFLIGYARSRQRDHGLYFGPLDLQIEFIECEANALPKK